MGRKLTSYERLIRELERDQEREKRANEVAARREEARREREEEEAERQEEKERQLERKISAANRQVTAYETFISDLTALHDSKSVPRAKEFHTLFSTVNPVYPDQIKYLSKPKSIGEFSFYARPFEAANNSFIYEKEEELNHAKQFSKFTEDEYIAHFKRTRFNKRSWTFYFILLLPIALLHYLSIRKSIYDPSEYTTFNSNQQALANELQSDRDKLQHEHDVIENKRIEAARRKHTEEVALERKTAQASHDSSMQVYQEKLNEYENKVLEIQEKHVRSENEKVRWYTACAKGEGSAIQQLLELLFPIRFKLNKEFLSLDPSAIDVGYAFTEPTTLTIVISLDKELNYIPESGYRLTPSGKDVSEFVLTQKARNEHLNTFICSLALAYLRSAFDHCSVIHTMRIEVSIPGTNKATGSYEDEVILHMEAERKTYQTIRFDAIDPTEAIKNFNHAFKPVGKKGEAIPSKISEDTLTWSTPDDADLNQNLDPQVQLTFYKYLGVEGTPANEKNKQTEANDYFAANNGSVKILLQEIEAGFKFAIIKLLHDESGIELVELKKLVESTPTVICRTDSIKKAEEFARVLKSHGAKVEVRIDT